MTVREVDGDANQVVEALGDHVGSRVSQQVIHTADVNEADRDMAVLGIMIIAQQPPPNCTRNERFESLDVVA